MGMAAAQCRFFQYTTRKNDIGLQLSRLSNDKVELSRDRQNASRAYQEALSSKTLKWSNNGGVSYIDLTYSSLMSPSAMNQQEPCILTDSKDRVVVDSKYQKYAELIAPNGVSNGTYASRRAEILANLVGVEESKFGEQVEKNETVKNIKAQIEEMKGDDVYKYRNNYLCSGVTGMLKALDKSRPEGAFKPTFAEGASSWADAYENGGKITFGSYADLKKVIEDLKRAFNFYPDLNPDSFLTETNATWESVLLVNYPEKLYEKDDKGKTKLDANNNPIELSGYSSKSEDEKFEAYLKEYKNSIGGGLVKLEDNGKYTLDVGAIVNIFLNNITAKRDDLYTAENGTKYDSWVNTTKEGYETWKPQYENWVERYNGLQAALKEAEYANQSVFTADEERKIAFYDAIFTSIDEKGWVYNDKINDNNYLNNMLQNGNYYLTTKIPSLYKEVGSKKENYDYFSQLAVNNEHVFLVNNTDIQNEAITEYEYKKSIISAKETRIDTRMKSLETELSAVNTMMQALESHIKEEIETGFKGIVA